MDFKNEKASPKVQEIFGRLSFATFWRLRIITPLPRKLLKDFHYIRWMEISGKM
jgi:hypothetical protein